MNQQHPMFPNASAPPLRDPASGSIEGVIRTRLARGGKALVPFLTAGFPTEDRFVAALRAMAEAGCDAIEVGIPFSDPIADGPVIQRASQHALEHGMTLRRAFDALDRADVAVPKVLMSYLNPIVAYRGHQLARDARAVGVGGLVIPDGGLIGVPLRKRPSTTSARMNPETTIEHLHAGGLEVILLAAPTTDPLRLKRIGRKTRGFLYAVTVVGVTGPRDQLPRETVAFLRRARKATMRPVLAGFGIAHPGTAAGVAAHCDGVIVGSAIINLLTPSNGRKAIGELSRFLRRLRRTLGEHGE